MAETVRQLGRYELLKRIAKGGMGEIYLARMRGAGGFEKHCIIKTILPHLAEEEEFVEKFLDEGRIVVQLVHGNIVPVFDMGEEDGEYFIAMEYIAGRDLRELTKRVTAHGDTVPVDLALFIASELCKGLDYAHRKADESGRPLGIVHRDVSPSNVLISREGEVKIIDFGIARAAGKLSKTVSGRIQGKFCYMSPEQASGKALDARSDIFSTGVVLYELLTGFRPFEGDSDLESLDLVRQCEFDVPSTFNAEVPAEVDAIVAQALAKNPEDRYPTIDKLQIAILQYLYTTGSSPSANDVGSYLAEVFPEGLERDDLRSARDARPPKKMSLDEALDWEFENLEGHREIDPLQTTAVSASAAAGTESGSLAVDGDSDALSLSGPATLDTVPEPRPDPDRSSGRASWLAAGIALVLVIVGVAYGVSGPGTGTLVIESDPSGARILVDGVTVLGARTPHTMHVELGQHKVRLEKEGFESREITVDVREDGEEKTISASDGRLQPRKPTRTSRNLVVTTDPPDAALFDGDIQIGTGKGTPIMLEPDEELRIEARREGCRSVKHLVTYQHPDDALAIRLDCKAVQEQVDAGVNQPEEVRPATSDQKSEQKSDAARQMRIVVATEPAGAAVQIDGKTIGNAPVTHTAQASDVLAIAATLPGYEPIEVRKRASSIRGGKLTLELRKSADDGCLNVRLQYPGTAEIAIDGAWLDGARDYRLERHPLSAGKHQVRIRNGAISFDKTYSVDVRPGRGCALLVVDERT